MSQWLSPRLPHCFNINTSLQSSKKKLDCSVVTVIVNKNTFRKSCFQSTESCGKKTCLPAYIFHSQITIAKRCSEATWAAGSSIMQPSPLSLLVLNLCVFPFEDCVLFSLSFFHSLVFSIMKATHDCYRKFRKIFLKPSRVQSPFLIPSPRERGLEIIRRFPLKIQSSTDQCM